MSKRYIALIADATASRLLPPARRARLQADARAAALELNRGYARVLAARFAVTLGDELQCLLPSPAPLWEIAHQIRARLPAVDWVVGCGLGPISTPLAPTAPEIDGPCFHQARAALDRAKRLRLVFTFGGFPSGLAPLATPSHARLWWGRAALLATGYLYVSGRGIVLIRSVLELSSLQMRRDEDRTAGAIAVARGRAIGSLERALALTLVLLGEYGAVGWIIAAKSLARFKALEEREFAEYFLVGTLASFLLAVLAGVGLRVLLNRG